MSSDPVPSTAARCERAAEARYQWVRSLGSGGMASVYEVVELSTGKHVALKRLHPQTDAKRQRRMLELFEREFYTLSQIAHPRVVAAYDYGVDAEGPYYTMELLEGSELQTLAPVPWEQACRIGRDVCSALSLLHSRRLVYRDLNPRNVHCLADGSAKLIDFGATTPLGPTRQVVGTPAYCAPEGLDLQPLDARADLFSLGATLYFALTARHAYPARTFDQLRGLWKTLPLRPSEIVPGIPPALDGLVMDLLHLEPAVRPSHAAEVVEKLAVIEGRPLEDPATVSQAYLSTPTLVGREAVIARVRAKLLRSLRGCGNSILLSGAAGCGRSRLLAACLLEAKLLGALALRADANDGAENYGVVRALALGLLESAPELCQRSAEGKLGQLGHALPELLARAPETLLQPFEDENRERAQLLVALREWFLAIARERTLLLAIDDLHAIDEPSAALLALLAHEASKHALTITATCESGAIASAPSALKLFETAATTLRVLPLSAENTEQLLGSVFGEVPQLQSVAHKLHAISLGNPRDSLQLAQYLVDRGLARYRAGAWSLPSSFDDADLPATMAQALRAQVEALDPRTRELACLMSLADDRELGSDELIALHPDQSARLINERLQQLITAQVARRGVADQYTVAHRGFHAALQQGLDDPERVRLHCRLADLFSRRLTEEFRRAQHLLAAGEEREGLDVLVAYAAASQNTTENRPLEFVSLVRSMPDNWLDVYVRAIALCERQGRPALQLFVLRYRLAGLVNVMGVPSAIGHSQLLALLGQLQRESGLDDFAQLDPSSPAAERLKRALERAQARHAETREAERGLPPQLAIRNLVRTLISISGMAAAALDYWLWAALPSLAPLASLSPAMPLMDMLVEGVGARIAGRHEAACAAYRQIVDHTSSAERAGLDEVNNRFLRLGVMCGLGVMEAGMGLASTTTWADAIESEPLHQVNAVQIRILQKLWQGRVREADSLRERVELLRIESSPRQLSDGLHLLSQVAAHAHSDDLTHMKQVLEELRAMALRFPAWAPVVHYAFGEYQRIRGDHAAAALQLKTALDACTAGTHQIWPHAAGAYTRVLCLLDRRRDAVEFATDALAAAEKAELGYLIDYLRMPFAIALAETGAIEPATELADAVIVRFEALQSEGLNLVLAYETRTRVAILAKDQPAYEVFAKRCMDRCRAANSRVLRSKYERLVRSAIAAAVHSPGVALPQNPLSTVTLGTQLTSILVGCDKPTERAARALQVLLTLSGSEQGFLYLMGDHGPLLSAQVGALDPPPELAGAIDDFIDQELLNRELRTRSLEDGPIPSIPAPAPNGAARHHLVLLSHRTPQGGFAITGAAALSIAANTPTFVHPGTLAVHLSRLVFDAGDVTPLLAD